MGEMKRRFTKEYKIVAVRLATVGDKSLAQVARELGCDPMCCERKRQFSAAPSPRRRFRVTVVQPEPRGVAAVRREVEQLKQERDFLKKAVAYFAKDPR